MPPHGPKAPTALSRSSPRTRLLAVIVLTIAGFAAFGHRQSTNRTINPPVSVAAASHLPPPNVLAWSELLGGRGAEDAYALAVDPAGGVVFAGTTGSSTLGTTRGALSDEKRGAFDGFLARLSPDGQQYEMLTYLGGTGSEAIFDIAIDQDGSILAVGYTTSTDFPTHPAGYATASGGHADGFIVRIDPTGSRLLGASYLGGVGNDSAMAVAVDASGRVYVAGEAAPDFPATYGLGGAGHAGKSDVYVARLSPDLSSADYVTLIGGSGADCTWCSMTVTEDGRAVIVSQSDSDDLPVTADAFDPTANGKTDAYVARLATDGMSLEYATYLGGSGAECAEGCSIALDRDGGIWLAGTTFSSDFPTQPRQSPVGAGADAFIAHLADEGRTLSLARKVVGARTELVQDIELTAEGDVLLLMVSDSTDLPVTADAFDATANGGADLVLLKLNPTSGDVTYGTYIGSRQADGWLWPKVVSGSGGRLYLAGGTFSTDFPGSGGTFGGQFDAKGDAFALMFAAVPTPTPAPPGPSNLYLPIALHEHCARPHIDVALVIDASSSMRELDASGRSNLDAVVAAADEFLNELHLAPGRDRAAVISFNATAHLGSDLTHDRASLLTALRNIQTARETRIHTGVDRAADLLATQRPSAVPVIVVFSDGNTTPEHARRAIDSADSARNAGIRVYAVGYGRDVNATVLNGVAGDPAHFHRGSSHQDVADHLIRLAPSIRCGGHAYWPLAR